jgi:hypothetical protein
LFQKKQAFGESGLVEKFMAGGVGRNVCSIDGTTPCFGREAVFQDREIELINNGVKAFLKFVKGALSGTQTAENPLNGKGFAGVTIPLCRGGIPLLDFVKNEFE